MKNFDTLHVYCTKGVRAKLVELAEANRRSLSSEIQVLIEQAHAKMSLTQPKKES